MKIVFIFPTSSRLSNQFVVSGGQDCTLKVWSLPAEFSGELHHLQSQATEHAHDKDINSVVVAPNDKLVCSGSQDRTAKVNRSHGGLNKMAVISQKIFS